VAGSLRECQSGVAEKMMQRSRYGQIRDKDLSDWRTWHDAAKGRYGEAYDELGFWHTLDSKVVALTFRVPILGAIPRIILALFGSNRYEPYPIANYDATQLWPGDPPWKQWIKWHLRNPWCDLRKFYLGFGYALEVEHVEKPWGWVHWARFAAFPFALPFPEWETRYFVVGWEQRGILNASL